MFQVVDWDQGLRSIKCLTKKKTTKDVFLIHIWSWLHTKDKEATESEFKKWLNSIQYVLNKWSYTLIRQRHPMSHIRWCFNRRTLNSRQKIHDNLAFLAAHYLLSPSPTDFLILKNATQQRQRNNQWLILLSILKTVTFIYALKSWTNRLEKYCSQWFNLIMQIFIDRVEGGIIYCYNRWSQWNPLWDSTTNWPWLVWTNRWAILRDKK